MGGVSKKRGKAMSTVTKGDKPTPEQQAIIDEIAEWIDTSVLAETIAEDLVDEGMEVSKENMKAVWYNILENELHENIRYAIAAIRDGWKP
jgi:hypothetical protein